MEVPALLQKIELPQDCHEGLRQLLMDLSSVIVTDDLPDDVDLRSITLGEEDADSRKDWVERITRLTPSDRLSCCGHSKASVRIVEGRALFLEQDFLCSEQDHEDKLLFGSDPIAWIRNGLWALDQRVLPSLLSLIGLSGLRPCPAMIIQPCELPGGRKITAPTIPAVYVGTLGVNKEIDRWRAIFWFREIREGYALAGKELHASWVQRAPGASEPDPVYRFLLKPCEDLRNEALLFLRHAHGKVQGSKDTGGSSVHTDPPPENQGWRGPIEGQLAELAERIHTTEKTLKTMSMRGTLWLRKVAGQRFQVWFKTNDEYSAAFASYVAPKQKGGKKGAKGKERET
jgi:hypothetical protein